MDDSVNIQERNENDFDTFVSQRNSSPPLHYSTSELLSRHRGMRSEIAVLNELIQDKYKELDEIEKAETKVDECDYDKVSSTANELAYKRKLKSIIQAVTDLEDFTNEDGLNENVVDEYVRHLQRSYDRILILGTDAVRLLKNATKEWLKEYLDAKHATEYEKVLFILKENGHYSLILFNSMNASFYHYDTASRLNAEVTEQFVFKLRRYFQAEQLVVVERNCEYADSSLYAIDSMMKIILTSENENTNDVSPIQLLNLPSQPDYLKIIVMSRYIVTKLEQIENIITEDVPS